MTPNPAKTVILREAPPRTCRPHCCLCADRESVDGRTDPSDASLTRGPARQAAPLPSPILWSAPRPCARGEDRAGRPQNDSDLPRPRPAWLTVFPIRSSPPPAGAAASRTSAPRPHRDQPSAPSAPPRPARGLRDIDIYLFDHLLRGRLRRRAHGLDAGCGGGRNLVYLLRAGFDVHAVDRDERAVRAYRTRQQLLRPAAGSYGGRGGCAAVRGREQGRGPQ